MQEGVVGLNKYKITYWSRKLGKSEVGEWSSQCKSYAIMEFSNDNRLVLKIDEY